MQRIVLEMLAVTLSKSARARSIQLPAWNEALGLAPSRGTSNGRCGCNRCSPTRATSSSTTTSSTAPTVVDGADRRAGRRSLGGARRDPGPRRCVRRRRHAEDQARVVDGRAHPPDRERRAGRRRGQPVHRDGAVAARGRRGDPARRSPGRAQAVVDVVRRGRTQRDEVAVRRIAELASCRRASARTSCRRRSPWRAPVGPPANGGR